MHKIVTALDQNDIPYLLLEQPETTSKEYFTWLEVPLDSFSDKHNGAEVWGLEPAQSTVLINISAPVIAESVCDVSFKHNDGIINSKMCTIGFYNNDGQLIYFYWDTHKRNWNKLPFKDLLAFVPINRSSFMNVNIAVQSR